MGIIYTNVVLECDYGSEELTAVHHEDYDGTVVFKIRRGDDFRTVYVTADEARQFSDHIRVVADKAEGN